MKAVWLEEFGGPEVLVAADALDPVPGPGQALIEVAFANITFVETMFRASGFGPFETELPMIPGNGVGGVVASVGVEVDEQLIGKRVVASTGGSGGYAERAAVDAAGLVEVPEDLELEDAVALLADGRTAMMLVRKAGLREGERVLVEAAAGGVGTLLVQLARAAGASVVAAAGGACKVEVARGIGVEVAVDYREPGWAERVSEALGAVDVVFDGGGRRRRRIRFQAARPRWPNGPFRDGERRMGEDIGRGRRRARGGVDRPVAAGAGGDASFHRGRFCRGCGRPIAAGDRATVPPGSGG